MKSITVETISDNHGYLPKLQGADLLLHAGDWSSGRGSLYETETFFAWMGRQPHKMKVCIAGNHDFPAQRDERLIRGFAHKYGVTYLQDEATEFEGFGIYGSPWQPVFYNWAFNLPRSGPELKAKWDAIPGNFANQAVTPGSTDILITHGPPWGIGDAVHRTYEGHDLIEYTGCELLKEALFHVKPQLHLFGHIHQGVGSTLYHETLCVNASLLDEQYKPYKQLPPVLTLTKEIS